jgi:hypothetical protein
MRCRVWRADRGHPRRGCAIRSRRIVWISGQSSASRHRLPQIGCTKRSHSCCAGVGFFPLRFSEDEAWWSGHDRSGKPAASASPMKTPGLTSRRASCMVNLPAEHPRRRHPPPESPSALSVRRSSVRLLTVGSLVAASSAASASAAASSALRRGLLSGWLDGGVTAASLPAPAPTCVHCVKAICLPRP